MPIIYFVFHERNKGKTKINLLSDNTVLRYNNSYHKELSEPICLTISNWAKLKLLFLGNKKDFFASCSCSVSLIII